MTRPRHRPALAGALLAALLAGSLAGCDGSPDAGAGAPTTSLGTTTSATPATPATSAPPGATGSASPGASTAPPPVTPGPPRALRVDTEPEGARVTVVAADGRARRGASPLRLTVPGGEVRLTVARAGYATVRRTMQLTGPRRVHVWLDPAGLLLRSEWRAATGPNPKQVAYRPDGRQVWVALLGSPHHGIEVFDTGTGRLLRRIPTGAHGAVEVIFAPDGKTAYVSQMWTGTVLVVDTARLRVTRVLHTRGTWSKEMVLSPDATHLYVSNWVSNDVSEIDLATGRARLIRTVDTPRGLALSPDGTRLYVAGFDGGDLQVISLASRRGRVLLHTGGAMRHLVADPDRGLIYADDMALGEVFVVDTRTDRVRRLGRTDRMPNTIDLSPDGRVLYVSCRGRNNPVSYGLPGPEWGSVVVLDTRTGRELDAIVGGNQPTGLDVSPDGRHLAFTDFLDADVRTYTIPPYQVYASGHGGRARSHLADLPKG